MSYKHHLAWGESKYPIIWNRNPYIWSDVYVIIEEAIGKGGGGVYDWQKEHPEKKRKLIKLICTIDHENYKEEKYNNDDVFLTVDDIKILEKYVTKQLNISIK